MRVSKGQHATTEHCPAWADGQHLFSPGFMVSIYKTPFQLMIIGESFRRLDEDDHRTEAKACRCGKVVMVKPAFKGLKGKGGYIEFPEPRQNRGRPGTVGGPVDLGFLRKARP